jgi:hypothetical protein
MAEVKSTVSGAAQATPFDMRGVGLMDPLQNYELGQFLCAWPGAGDGDAGQRNGDYDQPLPNIAAFDRLLENEYTPQQVESLVNWIEPLTTCQWVMKHHGSDGLKRVLRGIAKAACGLKVPMKSRTRHTAYVCGFIED